MKFLLRAYRRDMILSTLALIALAAALIFLPTPHTSNAENIAALPPVTAPPETASPETEPPQTGEYISVQDIDYEVLYCKDPSLPEGQTQILVPGVNGQLKSIGQAVYVNGVPESITVSQTQIMIQPVSQIVAVGTGENIAAQRQYPLVGEDFIYTAGGEILYYSRVETFQATAYTSGIGGVTNTTACGTQARVGAVAVDPSVIPYYTKMYIVSEDGQFDYGESSAEDCGGAIRGKIIDLYFATVSECYQFGRRPVQVYFLTEDPV